MSAVELKTQAIVTRAVPYNESDMIVTLVSVEYGKLTATAKGCLKPKAKLRFATQPMNFGNYILSGKNGRYIIADCTQIESFNSITLDIEKFYAASLTLDVLQKLTKEQPQPKLFVRALETLNTLASTSCDTNEVVTDMLVGVIADSGFSLDFSRCNVCGCIIDADAFFADADGIVCPHCQSVGGVAIDSVTRGYLAGQNTSIPPSMKTKANMLLSQLVYTMLGVRIDARYFTELL